MLRTGRYPQGTRGAFRGTYTGKVECVDKKGEVVWTQACNTAWLTEDDALADAEKLKQRIIENTKKKRKQNQ